MMKTPKINEDFLSAILMNPLSHCAVLKPMSLASLKTHKGRNWTFKFLCVLYFKIFSALNLCCIILFLPTSTIQSIIIATNARLFMVHFNVQKSIYNASF